MSLLIILIDNKYSLSRLRVQEQKENGTPGDVPLMPEAHQKITPADAHAPLHCPIYSAHADKPWRRLPRYPCLHLGR